jgi:hypothetical protein
MVLETEIARTKRHSAKCTRESVCELSTIEAVVVFLLATITLLRVSLTTHKFAKEVNTTILNTTVTRPATSYLSLATVYFLDFISYSDTTTASTQYNYNALALWISQT